MSLWLSGTRKKGDKGGLDCIIGALGLLVGMRPVSAYRPEFGKFSCALD